MAEPERTDDTDTPRDSKHHHHHHHHRHRHHHRADDDLSEEAAVLAGLTLDPDPATGAVQTSLTTSDILREQEKTVREISEAFSLDPSLATALLRRWRWKKDRLLNALLEAPSKVLADVGYKPPHATSTRQSQTLVCIVCGESSPVEVLSSLACRHPVCRECWEGYLQVKIGEGDCFMTCPAHKCCAVATQELVAARVSKEMFERYTAVLARSFVDQSSEVKWCPAPGCGRALKADQCHEGIGFCTCGCRFCWKCLEEAHAPASCEEVASWRKKCKDDSETAHWINANTRPCPNCKSQIEKNGGCNHMSCRVCKHEFCWVCKKPWPGHSDFYSCARYEAQQRKEEDKRAKKGSSVSGSGQGGAREVQLEESKAALEKYLHYYERVMNHELSSKFEAQQRERSVLRARELRETDAQYRDTTFLMEATEKLLECRKALKASYVKAYYMPEGGTERMLFEMLQSDLEKATERLSEIMEKPLEKLDRVETKNATALCSVALKNLLAPPEASPSFACLATDTSPGPNSGLGSPDDDPQSGTKKKPKRRWRLPL